MKFCYEDMKSEDSHIKPNINFIIYLNAISAVAVVTLHTNACFWEFSRNRWWITANVIECVLYFAVPVFLMISGATLINYREKYDTKTFFYKRIKKTVIPFIAWSLFGAIFYASSIGGGVTDTAFMEKPLEYLIDGILHTKFVGIYGFFIGLFTLYLMIPLFAAVEEAEKKRVFIYLVSLGFVLNFLFPFLDRVLPGTLFSGVIRLDIGNGNGYLWYALTGYLLTHFEVSKKERYVIYLLGAAGLLLHIGGTWRLSFEAGEVVKTYKGYGNVPCMLYSVAIFCLAKQLFAQPVRLAFFHRLILLLGRYSFAIYLLHWFMIKVLRYYFPINVHAIIYRLGTPLVIIPICILIAWGLRKVPLLRQIVP